MEESSEHAVIVHFTYGSTDLDPLFALEDQIEQALADADAGEFDGDEVAADGSDGFLYVYGPDADRLWEVILPLLAACPFMKGATATKRYGPPEEGVREVAVRVGV